MMPGGSMLTVRARAFGLSSFVKVLVCLSGGSDCSEELAVMASNIPVIS